jgi:hypothetical protein
MAWPVQRNVEEGRKSLFHGKILFRLLDEKWLWYFVLKVHFRVSRPLVALLSQKKDYRA